MSTMLSLKSRVTEGPLSFLTRNKPTLWFDVIGHILFGCCRHISAPPNAVLGIRAECTKLFQNVTESLQLKSRSVSQLPSSKPPLGEADLWVEIEAGKNPLTPLRSSKIRYIFVIFTYYYIFSSNFSNTLLELGVSVPLMCHPWD